MVPVLDSNKKPLMPCTEKRARKLKERKQAVAYWQKGIFCIRLLKEPSDRKYQPVALGVDPGSKREGYTAITKKRVVLNVTSNTPDWVKAHMESRRLLRRARRQRKTPYRQMRLNRATLRTANRIPPSTRARWQAKLRIITLLQKMLPITIINVENAKVITKQNNLHWNRSFVPIEMGKNYFYSEIEKCKLQLIKTEGYDTKQHRDKRNFEKSKEKLDYVWETHNVDSHSLAEMALQAQVKPFRGVHRIKFIEYHRRQTHIQQPQKNNVRKQQGTTKSFDLQRGSIVVVKNEISYVGGISAGRVGVHSVKTGKRRMANRNSIKLLYISKYTTLFLHS